MKANCSRILVVDDTEFNRDLLCRQLRRQGYVVSTAVDGLKAMESIRRSAFDLILLDVMMPEMDGMEVLAALKADPALRHIPVIMISALDDMDSVIRCIELGAEDYLPKPFNPVLLRARIGACLEKKRLRDQEQAYLRTLKQELDLGRRIQADFLPAMLPQAPGWEVAAAFHPAREVAGDFYDAFELPGNRLALLIADVCDKGVGAALYMTLVRSLLRAFAEQSPNIHDAVILTNNYIVRHHHNSQPRMFATLFFGVVDMSTGLLTYINGGHLPPLLLCASGQLKTLLEPTGPAVGWIAEGDFGVAEVYLEPGDMLLAYTDGITEARRASGDLFGEERLLALLDPPAVSLTALMERIKNAVQSYIGNNALNDDITMLALRYH